MPSEPMTIAILSAVEEIAEAKAQSWALAEEKLTAIITAALSVEQEPVGARKALEKIRDLRFSEAEDPLDDACDLAETALVRWDKHAAAPVVDVEEIAAMLYEAANPTMKWSYLWPSRNHLHAAVRQRYVEAAAQFQDRYAAQPPTPVSSPARDEEIERLKGEPNMPLWERIAQFLKLRDEHVFTGEADDDERLGSAAMILTALREQSVVSREDSVWNAIIDKALEEVLAAQTEIEKTAARTADDFENAKIDENFYVTFPAKSSAFLSNRSVSGDAVRVKHKKRGSEYEVIGIGKMQAENWEEREYCAADEPVPGASVDMAEVVVYRSIDDGSLWIRPRKEFEDGRFEVRSALVTSDRTEAGGMSDD